MERWCRNAVIYSLDDECDLGRLSDDDRADVFAAFGAELDMQLYGRGIRRRLAPMLRCSVATGSVRNSRTACS